MRVSANGVRDRRKEGYSHRFSRRRRFFAVGILAVICASCRRVDSAALPDVRGQLERTTFAASWTVVDSVVPEQTDNTPIVRISGIDMDSLGRLLIGDVSNGSVKLFARNGRLLRTIGRKGRGPGEFEAPRLPRFAPGGRIYVADVSLRRVSIFDTAGVFVKAVSLAGLGDLSGFVVRGRNSWWFATKLGADPHVLLETDSLGSIRRSLLKIGEVLPQGQRDHSVWKAVRSFSLAVQADTAFVTCTISDSLWTVDLTTGATKAQRLKIPGYIAPAVPSAPGRTIAWLQTWYRTFHSTPTVYTVDGGVVVPFVKGVLNYGDSAVVAQRDRSGRWTAFETTTPLVFGGRSSLLGLAAPQGDSLVMRVYRRTRP